LQYRHRPDRKNASFRVLWLNLRGIELAGHPFVITDIHGYDNFQ